MRAETIASCRTVMVICEPLIDHFKVPDIQVDISLGEICLEHDSVKDP